MTSDQTHNVLPALADSLIPIDQLHPHPANARRRDDRAMTEIRTSLRTNGQYRRIVTRRLGDGTVQILAGHGTTEAARAEGWSHIAVEVHDDVDDQTALRIVAVDNRTGDLSADDPAAMAELLRLLDDLEGTGWSTEDQDALEASLRGDDPAELTDPDKVPSKPADPQSKLGDVWLLGPHRLAIGSGTDPDVVAAACDGQLADLFITDPPYNVDYTGKTADALKIGGDHQDDEGFRQLLAGLFAAALANTKRGGPAYVFHADTKGLDFRTQWTEAGWELKQVLVWVKDRFVLGRQDYHWQHEPIIYGWAPGAAHVWTAGRDLTTLLDDELDLASLTKPQMLAMLRGIREASTAIRHDRPAASEVHPTMKPVDLYVRLLEPSSSAGDLILDTCAGSGTAAIAAHRTRRRAALVELDPSYADVICRRYAEHTGTTPTHAETGIPFELPAGE